MLSTRTLSGMAATVSDGNARLGAGDSSIRRVRPCRGPSDDDRRRNRLYVEDAGPGIPSDNVRTSSSPATPRRETAAGCAWPSRGGSRRPTDGRCASSRAGTVERDPSSRASRWSDSSRESRNRRSSSSRQRPQKAYYRMNEGRSRTRRQARRRRVRRAVPRQRSRPFAEPSSSSRSHQT